MAEKSKLALLMGFDYSKSLPGTRIDLHRVISYVEKHMKPDDIRIVTDMRDEHDVMRYKKYIDSERTDVLYLFDKFNDEIHTYIDKEEFLFFLTKILTGVDYLFIYYSGHVADGELILSEDPVESLSIQNLLDIIQVRTSSESETFMVVDGCHDQPLFLGYSLRRGVYTRIRRRLTPRKKTLLVSPHRGIIPYATDMGSIFTKQMMDLLEGSPSLLSISHNINASIEMTSLQDVPTWFYSGVPRSLMWKGWLLEKPGYTSRSLSGESR